MKIKTSLKTSYGHFLHLLLIPAILITQFILLHQVVAQEVSTNPYVINSITLPGGRTIEATITPGPPTPPIGFTRTFVALPEPNPQAGINVLPDVPAFTWCFGCSATSASMIAGYYDRTAYPNMYTGPTNGGVMTLDNSSWGTWVDPGGDTRAQCPLSATRNGLDGRTTNGHVDDYWVVYGDPGPDPFIGNWPEHTYEDCTADFMKTNQSNYGSSDGSTTFYNYTDGSPLTAAGMESGGISDKDGGYGVKLFYESRGYTVTNMYNQYIYGYNGNTIGFTYDQYKAEIDAGRPVMFHVQGHTMVGIGYDDSSNLMYIHDTWDYSTHTMTWGGSYSGMLHYAVTIVELEPAPSLLGEALDNETLTWVTGGSADWESQDIVSYYDGDAAQSGAIDHDQITWVQTTMPVDGTLSFYWKVSSEESADYHKFYINDVAQDQISGEAGWQNETFTVSAGDAVKWAYEKNSSASSGSDAGWLDKVELFVPLNKALDNEDVTWETGGSTDWFGQITESYYDGDAAQSGTIDHDQVSWVQTTVAADSTLSFYWKVSSEESADYHKFYINDVAQDQISGEVDWQGKTYSISAGDNIKWTYEKNSSISSGADTCWLDKVQISPCRHYTIDDTVAYSFEDISSTGTNLGLSDNSSTDIDPLPFTFTFFGQDYDAIFISSEGVLNFSGNAMATDNQCIPAPTGTGPFIAPLWDELNVKKGKVYYEIKGTAPDRRLIIQWQDMGHDSNPPNKDYATFQVILYEGSNNILFQYKDVIFDGSSYDSGLSATVGIQGDVGCFAQYSCDSASLSNDFAILFATQGNGLYGDVNGDGTLDLADAIIALQTLSGVDIGGTTLSLDADCNGDGKIGIEEAIYILQKVSNLR